MYLVLSLSLSLSLSLFLIIELSLLNISYQYLFLILYIKLWFKPAYHIESKIIVYMCPTLAKIDYRNFMSVLLGESLI